MSISEWLTRMSEHLHSVLDEKNEQFSVGIKGDTETVNLSVTVTDQGSYVDAYVVAEPLDGRDIDVAVSAVNEVHRIISDDTYSASVGTDRKNRWAEATLRVDEEKLRAL